MLNEARTDYEVVNVLDEQYNPGVREAIKSYSQWPTIPQVRCGVVLPMHCLSLHINVLLNYTSRLLAHHQPALCSGSGFMASNPGMAPYM